jgi:hypothetical protein
VRAHAARWARHPGASLFCGRCSPGATPAPFALLRRVHCPCTNADHDCRQKAQGRESNHAMKAVKWRSGRRRRPPVLPPDVPTTRVKSPAGTGIMPRGRRRRPFQDDFFALIHHVVPCRANSLKRHSGNRSRCLPGTASSTRISDPKCRTNAGVNGTIVPVFPSGALSNREVGKRRGTGE